MIEQDTSAKMMENIRQRFLGRLKSWLPMFESYFSTAMTSNISDDELADIKTKVHKIAGSARTFGFSELNIHAELVEHHLDLITDELSNRAFSIEQVEAFQVFYNEAIANIISELKNTEASPSVPEQKKEIFKEYDYQILLVDDDELVRDLVIRGIKNEKYEIKQAENGKIAIDHLQRMIDFNVRKPDLIVMDVNMPEMNGFEALELIKQNSDLQSIPVIMLTRRDEDENVIRGISSGVLDYITKPFEVPELVNRIHKTLQRHKTKVLIADDDELIRDMLRQHFYRMGYNVLTTQNGNETMERLQTDKPDIAIVDIMMPGMDGLAVLKQTKANSATADIPVIMLSAKSQQENILIGLESGANDYITKPFDIDEVSARVSGILRRNKVA